MQAKPKPNVNPGAAPGTIDEYLAELSSDKRDALERLRRTIRAACPRAEECISYRIPAFRLDGKMLAWFGAASNHCSFFPGGVVEAYKGELEGFSTSKGTIRFQPDHPLPATLVRKLLNARSAAITAKQRRKPARAARHRRAKA